MTRSDRRSWAGAAARWGPLAAALIAGAAAGPGALARPGGDPPEGAEIRDLHVENTPSDLHVSFRLYGAMVPGIREQIESGLPVTFNHYVEVLRRRIAWFDATEVRKVVSSTVTYDTLTRQYRLTREVNGQVVETTVSDKPGDMERFMTSVERLRLCDPADLPGDRPLQLQVKSRVQRRFVLFFIPWNFETSWARVRLSLAGGEGEPPAAP